MYYLHKIIQDYWYNKKEPCLFLFILLLPLSKIYSWFITFRKFSYKNKIFRSYKLNVPVIIVGNITVGGTGKTPMVIYLANLLRKQGLKPGILSRGYRGNNKKTTLVVADSDPVKVGDEAVMLAKRTNCPVVVGANRVKSGEYLLKNFKVNVIVSDDGLQHYSLKRDLEIVVINSINRFGNGYCLPLGPLRESLNRLKEVDFLIANGEKVLKDEFSMRLSCSKAYKVCDIKNSSNCCDLLKLTKTKVHAIAGIGFPDNFFNYLIKLGFDIIPHAFIDHHNFNPEDLNFEDEYPIIMTEKDAVKCKNFSKNNSWFIPVDVELSKNFDTLFLNKLLDIA